MGFNLFQLSLGLAITISLNLFLPAQAQRITGAIALPNGTYRICSETHPIQDLFDEDSWCFHFWKRGQSVVGNYYYAPMREQSICIEGALDGSTVVGIGTETWYGWDEPINLQHLPQSPYVWDSPEIGGGYLTAATPHIVESGSSYASYWATIQFANIELNLSEFYLYPPRDDLPPRYCD